MTKLPCSKNLIFTFMNLQFFKMIPKQIILLAAFFLSAIQIAEAGIFLIALVIAALIVSTL